WSTSPSSSVEVLLPSAETSSSDEFGGTATTPSLISEAQGDGSAWMKLTVHHETTYLYACPVLLLPHRMMLRPRGSHEIAVLASSLSCSPEAELDWTQDVFGNLIATGTFSKPTAELVIVNDLTVEQSAAAWP